jgi:hypothetical protein
VAVRRYLCRRCSGVATVLPRGSARVATTRPRPSVCALPVRADGPSIEETRGGVVPGGLASTGSVDDAPAAGSGRERP